MIVSFALGGAVAVTAGAAEWVLILSATDGAAADAAPP
jgi:hypothetical protein